MKIKISVEQQKFNLCHSEIYDVIFHDPPILFLVPENGGGDDVEKILFRYGIWRYRSTELDISILDLTPCREFSDSTS